MLFCGSYLFTVFLLKNVVLVTKSCPTLLQPHAWTAAVQNTDTENEGKILDIPLSIAFFFWDRQTTFLNLAVWHFWALVFLFVKWE